MTGITIWPTVPYLCRFPLGMMNEMTGPKMMVSLLIREWSCSPAGAIGSGRLPNPVTDISSNPLLELEYYLGVLSFPYM
jgi:hypothetical protein